MTDAWGLIRTVPRGARNGLETGYHDYAYRGSKTLEAELPHECENGCGRRVNRPYCNSPVVCAVCRGYYENGAGRGENRAR